MRVILVLVAFFWAFSGTIAQEKKNSITVDNGVAISFKELQKTPKRATIDPSLLSDQPWHISIAQFGKRTHNRNKPILDSLKKVQFSKKKQAVLKERKRVTKSSSVTDPVVFNSFMANAFDGSVPSDNNLAVSREGYVVSVINSTLFFADVEGTRLLERGFEDYYTELDLPAFYFDPKILYDPVEDRFIMVVLNGATPGASWVVVSFSTDSNPLKPWNTYVLEGDPFLVDAWFDYPTIGISSEDLYISGNLFGEGYVDNLMYQIDKNSGYNGEELIWTGHHDVRGEGGGKAFTLVPISNGLDDEYGPGIYWICSRWFGGSVVDLYEVSSSTTNSPSISTIRLSTNDYFIPGDALQLNTDQILSTNDCRILSGYYENGNIHYVHNSSDLNGFSGINYGIIDTESMIATSSLLSSDTLDNAYPVMANFRNNDTVNESIIGFLRSGESIYPELRVINVTSDFEWSNSALVKAGENYINVLQDSLERWGDYSGIGRRHGTDPPEAYVAGIYGGSPLANRPNVMSNWIGAVGTQGFPPEAEFRATRTEGKPTFLTTFLNESTVFPKSIEWYFEGGQPETSTKDNQTVIYRNPGEFDVQLIASNDFGSDTLFREAYIKVIDNSTGIIDPEAGIQRITAYPNPVSQSFASIKIEIDETQPLHFELFDQNGRKIRTLAKDRVKAGLSVLKFSTEVLAQGTYFITVKNEFNKIIANEKIIVAR